MYDGTAAVNGSSRSRIGSYPGVINEPVEYVTRFSLPDDRHSDAEMPTEPGAPRPARPQTDDLRCNGGGILLPVCNGNHRKILTE